MSVLSPEVTFHKQQRIDYYCDLNNFVSPKLELSRKALVNISVELYLIYRYIVSDYCIKYVHNDLISDSSLFVRLTFLQIWSSNLLHLKLLASSESIIFYFSSLVLNLYHIRSIYMYEDFCCCFYSALSQWPGMVGCYIASTPGFFPEVSLLTQLIIKQRRCQITKIKPVLSARNYNYSAKQWNPKPFLPITYPWSNASIACLSFSLRCLSLHS